MQQKTGLFEEFPPTDAAAWKAQLLRDLKGESFDALVWHNENGFDIQPCYTRGELSNNYEPAFTHSTWDICVKARGNDAAAGNRLLLGQLNAGASSVLVEFDPQSIRPLLEGVALENISSVFFCDHAHASEFSKFLETRDGENLSCSIFPTSITTEEELQRWTKAMSFCNDLDGIRTVSIDALPFHNAGCFAAYEVAVILSALVSRLDIISSSGNIPKAKVAVRMGVNSDYFVQIAKLRALRRLWKLLSAEYGLENGLHLIAETSLTNKSVSGRYNNLLRTTVEAMAAIAGGCDELVVNEFDVLFPETTSLSRRMAVNQQLILREESYLDKVADVSCGSYYIESLTDTLAEKALDTFKGFQRKGGYFACLREDIFSSDIEVQHLRNEALVRSGKQVVVGVNRFHDSGEDAGDIAVHLGQLEEGPVRNAVLNYEIEHYFRHA
jgi:methylmalonyl-CoA mutase